MTAKKKARKRRAARLREPELRVGVPKDGLTYTAELLAQLKREIITTEAIFERIDEPLVRRPRRGEEVPKASIRSQVLKQRMDKDNVLLFITNLCPANDIYTQCIETVYPLATKNKKDGTENVVITRRNIKYKISDGVKLVTKKGWAMCIAENEMSLETMEDFYRLINKIDG